VGWGEACLGEVCGGDIKLETKVVRVSSERGGGEVKEKTLGGRLLLPVGYRKRW